MVIFLLLNNFTNNTADTSLFVYDKENLLIWIVIYVDDLIITGNNNKEIEIFIKHLCSEFKCRDLGIKKKKEWKLDITLMVQLMRKSIKI